MRKPEELEGLSLEYAFLKELEHEIVGNPHGPFAIYDKEEDVVRVFCHTPNVDAITTRLIHNAADCPLSIAKRFDAEFSVKEKVVTCTMRGFQGHGDSYAEAAMRAFLTLVNAKTSN